MSKKRLFLKALQDYDASHGTHFVREMEMTVESGLKDTGYSMQFWQDVRVYGLKEAVLYLKNGDLHRNLAAVESMMAAIMAAVQP
jgi:hypothetical protein